MSDYPNAGPDPTDFQEKIAKKHAAVVAAFGQPDAPYMHQEYPKLISKSVDGIEVTATVYSKAEEDSFLASPEPEHVELAPQPTEPPAAPEPPVMSATE